MTKATGRNGAPGAVAHLERQADEQEFLAHKPFEMTQLLHHANAIAKPDRVRWPPPFGRIIHADEVGRRFP